MHIKNPLLALLLVGLLLPAASFAQRVLRYSDHEPLGGMRTRFIKDVFFAAVERESNGRLKIDDRWDSSVATGYDALRVLGEGKAADMAVVVPEYSARELPLHQLFKGFLTGPSGANQVAFFQRAYAEVPSLSAELQKNQVVEVFLATGYPVAFFSSQPLSSLNDLRGHSWRSASFWHFDFLRNAGARPVTMPWGEGVFKAMRDRTLEGLMVNVDSGYMLKVHEVAPNVLLSRDLWLGHLYVVAMNRSVWEGLAPEDREAIRRAAQSAYRTLGAVMDQSFDAMLADLKAAGASVRQLNRSELDAWEAITQSEKVRSKWVTDQQPKGVMGASTALQQIEALLKTSLK